MAPLPQNSTDRVFVDYVTGDSSTSREHTVAIRKQGTTSVDTVQVRLLAVLQALGAGSFRTNWRVLRVRLQSAGQSFSIPQLPNAALFAFRGTSTATYAARLEAVESTFQGRTGVSGRRVDISLYRAAIDANDNFRVVGGSSGPGLSVQNAVAALQSSSSNDGAFLTIDGQVPTWYNYMNENYNSYWESRSRTT